MPFQAGGQGAAVDPAEAEYRRAKRRATVPLMCLTPLLGRYESVESATARVLLVDASGGYVGFIVPALNAIEAPSETPRWVAA